MPTIGVDFDHCRAFYSAKPKWAQFSNSGERTVDKYISNLIHPFIHWALSFILFVAIHHPHSSASTTSCVTGQIVRIRQRSNQTFREQLCSCWIVVNDGQRFLLFQLLPLLDCALSAADTSASSGCWTHLIIFLREGSEKLWKSMFFYLLGGEGGGGVNSQI